MAKNRDSLMLFAFVAVIVLLGAWLRFTSLDWEAISWNEGTLFGGSKEFAAGNFIYNFNDFATPPLVKYLGALVYYFYGYSEVLLRMLAAIAGVTGVVLVFFVTRKMYDEKTAVFATALTSFSIIHLAFSRMFLTEIFVSLFYTASFYLYYLYTRGRGPKKLFLPLGIFIGLALASKYLAIYLPLTIILHALLSGRIKVTVRNGFNLKIDTFLLKAFGVAVLAFFLVWPFSLYPIKVSGSVAVVGMPERTDSFTIGIPGIFLSPQEYIQFAFGREDPSAFDIPPNIGYPVVGYFSLFVVKESVIFVALFLAGLAAIWKKRKDPDMFVLLFIFTSLLLLWFQKYGWTYRYLTAILPLFSIVAARSVDLIKSANIQKIFIAAAVLLVFVNAIQAYPDYISSYSNLDNIFQLKPYDDELHMVIGFREGTDFIKENCPAVTGNAAGTVINYVEDPEKFFIMSPTAADLPICVYNSAWDNRTLEKVAAFSQDCAHLKTFETDGIPLRSVYYCR